MFQALCNKAWFFFRDDESKNTVFTFVGTSKFLQGAAADESGDAIESIVDKHILDKLAKEGEEKPKHKKQSVKKDLKAKKGGTSREKRMREAADRAAEKRFTLIQSKRNVPLSINEAGDSAATCDVITLESASESHQPDISQILINLIFRKCSLALAFEFIFQKLIPKL